MAAHAGDILVGGPGRRTGTRLHQRGRSPDLCAIRDHGAAGDDRPWHRPRLGELDHANYVRHGILGYGLLGEEGVPEAICRFASRHTGVGLSPADVVSQELPLPVADYRAETGEEKLVMYADKFHTKTDPPAFLSATSYAQQIGRFGQDKAAAFESMRELFGEPDLASLSST